MKRRRDRTTLVLAVALLVLATVAGTGAQSVPWRDELQGVRSEAEIIVGDDPLTVELSTSFPQQSLGLGYRNELADGRGMLFVNGEPSVQSFWMKGMRFCIDIIWIEGGEITGAAESVCPDPEGFEDGDRPRQSSEIPVTYVLEVPAGWLAEHGYGAGTPVQIPDGVGSGSDETSRSMAPSNFSRRS